MILYASPYEKRDFGSSSVLHRELILAHSILRKVYELKKHLCLTERISYCQNDPLCCIFFFLFCPFDGLPPTQRHSLLFE